MKIVGDEAEEDEDDGEDDQQRLNYLDDADLLEVFSHFVSSDVFAQAFHEDGVVVRVVLLP